MSSSSTTIGETGNAELVKQEFAKQAQRNYDNQAASSDNMMAWIKQHIQNELRPDQKVLDVSAGTGRMSRLIAPAVKEVVALDITKEMLAVGKEQADAAGINNIQWVVSKAQEMPFADNEFDLVVSRLALHHWDQPQAIISEIARVCKPGGVILLLDIVTPSNLSNAQGDHLNHLETVRDPSHVRFYRQSEFEGFLQHARPSLTLRGQLAARDNEVRLGQWLDLTDTPDVGRREITQALEDELASPENEQKRTGFRPTRGEDGGLRFYHSYVILAAQKQ